MFAQKTELRLCGRIHRPLPGEYRPRKAQGFAPDDEPKRENAFVCHSGLILKIHRDEPCNIRLDMPGQFFSIADRIFLENFFRIAEGQEHRDGTDLLS